MPLPLGANGIRRDLGPQAIGEVNRLLKESIHYGLDHRGAALDYALRYGRDLDRAKADNFVGMYVNDWTLDFGPAAATPSPNSSAAATPRGSSRSSWRRSLWGRSIYSEKCWSWKNWRNSDCLPTAYRLLPTGFPMHFRTRAIHVGNERDPQTGAVVPPVHLASTFVQPGAGEWGEFDYSRSGNPTRKNFETTLASLEGGGYALAFSTGMAATHCVTQLLSTGDHILAGADIYGGTYRLLA